MKEIVVRNKTIIDPDPKFIQNVLTGHAERGTLVTPIRQVRAEQVAQGWMVRVAIREEVRVPARQQLIRLHARALRWDTDHPVLAAMSKALLFVGTLFGIGTLAVVLLLNLLAGIDWRQVGGYAAIGVILFLVIANRLNHSGACPGIVSHCKGCKH